MAENPTFEVDPELIENEHIRITEDASGNLALEHKPSGNILTVDGNATISEVLQNGQNFDGEGTSNLTNLAAVETEKILGIGDVARDDSELDARLSNATRGGAIYLGQSNYSANRTISTRLFFEGTLRDTNGTNISGDWELSAPLIHLSEARLDGLLTISGVGCTIDNINYGLDGEITVSADEVTLNQLRGGSVTFESGTADGVIDASVNMTVTDNGTNIVGDVS